MYSFVSNMIQVNESEYNMKQRGIQNISLRNPLFSIFQRKYVYISQKVSFLFNYVSRIFMPAINKLEKNIKLFDIEHFFKTITKIQNNIQLHSK